MMGIKKGNILRIVFLIVLLSGIISAPLFAQEASLMAEEQAWLKAHSDIVLGGRVSYRIERSNPQPQSREKKVTLSANNLKPA